MEENSNIPPPPSGEIVMPKNIPAPPTGDIVMPELKKKESTTPTTTSSIAPVSQDTKPLEQSGVKGEPIDLPKSYRAGNKLNYKDLVGGQKYNLLKGGKPVTGTWDAEEETFIKDPLLNVTPQQKKEVGFLQAVEAGVNLEAPVETQEEMFGRVAVDVDNLISEAKSKKGNIDYLASYPSVQKLDELQKAKEATKDYKEIADIDKQISELRSKKMDDNEFTGIRFTDAEQKVYQNFLPSAQVEESKEKVKKLPKTDLTVGEAYDEVKNDSEYVQQVQNEVTAYNNMVNQYMIDKLPQEVKDRLEPLKGTNEYNAQLEKELVQSNEVENIIPALAFGLDRKLDALMEVGSNIGLDDDRLIQKKLADIKEKQMFGKNMASTRAELANSIGGMLPDVAAGSVFSPLMIASMASTMPNDFLEQSIAEQAQSGEPIDVNKAKKFALASTVGQTALLAGAGKLGAHGLNLVGKTTLKRAGELIYEMAKRGTKDAIVFGGLGTVMQNKINKAYDLAENDEYLKQGLHMAVIGGMFALKEGLGQVGKVSKKAQSEVDYLASYLPEEYTKKQVEQLVQLGKVSPTDGEETLDKLNTYRGIRNQIPAELSLEQMDKIYPLWQERRRIQAMSKDASAEFKNVLNGQVEDIDRKILIKSAVPLTSSEKMEYNKLSTAEAENKQIDKARLKYLRERMEAAKDVKEEKKEAKTETPTEVSVTASDEATPPSQERIDAKVEIPSVPQEVKVEEPVEGDIISYGKSGEKKAEVKFIDPNTVKVIAEKRGKSQDKLTGSNKINVPIVVDENGKVIDGNNRVAYAKENGIESIPSITVDGKYLNENDGGYLMKLYKDLKDKYQATPPQVEVAEVQEGADRVPSKEDRAQELEVKQQELSDAEADYEKLNRGLNKDLKENQLGLGLENADKKGKELKLIDDNADLSNRVADAKKKADGLREEVNRLQKLVDEDLDGQQKMELKEPVKLRGKDLLADALDRIAKKTGGKKYIFEGDERTSIIQDLSDVGRALIDMGEATAENVIQKIREYVKGKISDEDFDSIKDDVRASLGKSNGIKKTFLTKRAYEGELRNETKAELEKFGLTREIESQDEAMANAKKFVEAVGDEAALEAVRNGDVKGGEATAVWGTVLENIDKRIASAKSEAEVESLNQLQGELMNELDKRLTAGGREAAMMNKIYQESDLGYNLQRKIQEYKDANEGTIPAEVEKRFREWDKQLKEVKAKLSDAEARAKKAEEEKAISDIKESIEREKKTRKTYTQKAKGVADEIRKLKNKPFQFKDENGNVIDITTLGVTWNDVVETVAKAVEAGGKLADAIDGALKKADWYNNFSEKDKEAFKKQLAAHLAKPEITTTEGKLKIPHSVIRDFVERGIDNIDDLTKAVHEVVKETNPDVTEREVRDAITGYGKTVNPNMEQVEQDIRKMKRIGRITSALEDIANKKRPLRSGLQRDKLDAEERKLNKELKEAMKDLPVDAETEAQQLKTSLDAVKQRLQNQIEDLNREIETGEKTPVSERKVEYDSEAKALAEERDRVKAIHDEIFGKPELTDEQRINIATKALEKSISNLEEKLKTGDILPKKAESKTPETPELKALRDKREKLQEEIQNLRDATKVKKTPQEIATENAIEANRKSIEEKERRIRENDLSPTPKKEVADKNNAELKALRAKNEALDKQLQKLRNDAKVKRDASIVATETTIKSIERRTKDIQDRIKKNELEKSKKPSLVKNTPEYQKAKKKLEAEAEKLKKLQEAAGIPNKKRVELAKKAAQRRIEDLQRRIKEGDFAKKERKPLVEDSELTKLRAEKLRIQDEYDKELYKAKLKNRTKAEKIKDALWEIWGIPRILMATGEASFVGIQGIKQSIAHPTHSAQAFKNSWSAFKSEKNADKFLNNIKAQEWYPTLKKSKLALTEPHAEISAREELFYSGWTNMIWDNLGKAVVSPTRLKGKEAFDKAVEGWSKLNPFKAVERAAIGYLDTLRVMRFLDGMQMLEMQGKTFEKNQQDYKDVADAINTMTGRASLGAAEQIAPVLSKVFFSPRNWASSIKTATPYALYHFGKMTPTARKMAIADFSKFVGFTTGMVAMAAIGLNNDDDKETSVEFDPRSTDFMKLKLGDTRVDPWGGMQQQVVFSSRMIADALSRAFPESIDGAYKKQGKIYPLGAGGGFTAPKASDLITQQAINKLNPTASLLNNYLNTTVKKDGTRMGKFGEEYTLKGEMKDKFYPIFWGTVAELMKDDPTALDGLLAFYAFFGGGVNIYDNKKKSDKPKEKQGGFKFNSGRKFKKYPN